MTVRTPVESLSATAWKRLAPRKASPSTRDLIAQAPGNMQPVTCQL